MNDLLGAFFSLLVLWAVLRAMGISSENDTESAPSIDTQRMVEAVQAMFPHIPERSIRYDLVRSGSAEATCEKILQDGFLPTPPAQFAAGTETQQASQTQPPVPETSRAGSSTTGIAGSSTLDLIHRYRLSERLDKLEESSSSSQPSRPCWDSQPKDREAALRERKAQVVLQARK
ncbi:hypothetical protein MYAM1_000198 [Malassezia yamatoensis]|uniref:Coupling of ubiquitin conjugation to ER degradation protein 1 n=1 Tax=Malassezia yamatoensis TaxID=253288 RepID=A0AAJ6CFA0_9BASI|nr:hypothetical protein MYAM1_000198 [Malassezia yamatoensis]